MSDAMRAAAQVLIRRTEESDLSFVLAMLEKAGLPREGVASHFSDFLVARREGRIVGAIGLERYGSIGLLRSAVVEPGLQRSGIGSLLVDGLFHASRDAGISRLILLTETAEEYFRRKGFSRIDAREVSGPITSSAEFTGACPVSAVCMEKWL